MNITQIIQKKFPKFTKEKYSDLFEEIIRAALNPVSDQKVESITCDILSVKSKKKKKQSFWFDILTSSFRSDNIYSTESKKIPQLIISYLKLKAKEIVPKLVSLSVKYNRSNEYVLRCYLDVCRYEINKKKVSYLIKKRKNPSVNDVPSKLTKNENGLEIEDEEGKENKTLNLFIGSFDMRSFLEHNQSIYMKKSENCNTFFFVNNNKEDFQNTKNQGSFSKRKYSTDNRKEKIANTKIYGKKGKMFIHRFDSFKFLPCPTTTKETYPKKKFKNLNINTEYNYMKAYTKSTSRDKNTKEINDYKAKNTLSNNNRFLKTRNLSITTTFVKKDKIYMPMIQKNSTHSIDSNFRKQNLKMKNFLTKEDLYY